MTFSQTVRGVVFCGGASRRMGTDKARLREPASDRTLLERAASVLANVCDSVVLACGPTRRYDAFGYEVVLDTVEDGGPLAGLAAALDGLADARASWLCVLACDMPNVDASVFRALLGRAERDALDVCMLEGPKGVEPLCAVYHARCAPAVRRALESGGRRMISFHGPGLAVGSLRVAELPDGEKLTANMNTRADYERELGGPAGPRGEDYP